MLIKINKFLLIQVQLILINLKFRSYFLNNLDFSDSVSYDTQNALQIISENFFDDFLR